MKSIFVTDLHGSKQSYNRLFEIIKAENPVAVFIGGDVLPNYYSTDPGEFTEQFLKPGFERLKKEMTAYPVIFLILGNDDPAYSLPYFTSLHNEGYINFLNSEITLVHGYEIAGYSYIPPTPFLLKDWEKYDVSRFVPRGSVSPEEGIRTADIAENIIKYSTIAGDMKELAEDIKDFSKSIFLFHSPPGNTNLDMMIGTSISGEEQIVNVGSIAVRRFIDKHQPLLTLHGHIHESSEISGSWKDLIGRTFCFSAAAAHGNFAVIRFDTENPENAARELL